MRRALLLRKEVEETTEEVVAEIGEETVESVSVDEDIAALLAGEELSEGFKKRQRQSLAAIASKVTEAVSKELKNPTRKNSSRNFPHIKRNSSKS